MDRLETYNMTVVSGTVEQNCSYANPTNSIYTNIDAASCFFNGGAINIYNYKLTQCKICAKTLETPFPVLGCAFNDFGVPIDPSLQYRTIEECASLLGIKRPEADEGFEFPDGLDWNSAGNYAGTPAYNYWLTRKELGDTEALNPRFPFVNFFDRTEISFYGKPFGVCGLFGYVNGGYMHCNSFDWSLWDGDVLDVLVDTQSWQASPDAGLPNYNTTRERMEIDFTNDQIFYFEQAKLANFVRPAPKRLSFTDLYAYVVDLSADNRGHIVGEQKIGSPNDIDWSTLGNVEWGYGTLTCRDDVLGGGLLKISSAATSVDLYHFDVKASKVEISPALELDTQSSIVANNMGCEDTVDIMNFSLLQVGNLGIDGAVTVTELSRLIASQATFSDTVSLNGSTAVSEFEWVLQDEFTASNFSSIQGQKYKFNDQVSIENSNIQVDEIETGNGVTLESVTATIGTVKASDTWEITNGSNVTVDSWTGPPANVDQTSVLIINNYSP